jgi:hypothetical protein
MSIVFLDVFKENPDLHTNMASQTVRPDLNTTTVSVKKVQKQSDGKKEFIFYLGNRPYMAIVRYRDMSKNIYMVE